jgi:hypothetical protein
MSIRGPEGAEAFGQPQERFTELSTTADRTSRPLPDTNLVSSLHSSLGKATLD